MCDYAFETENSKKSFFAFYLSLSLHGHYSLGRRVEAGLLPKGRGWYPPARFYRVGAKPRIRGPASPRAADKPRDAATKTFPPRSFTLRGGQRRHLHPTRSLGTSPRDYSSPTGLTCDTPTRNTPGGTNNNINRRRYSPPPKMGRGNCAGRLSPKHVTSTNFVRIVRASGILRRLSGLRSFSYWVSLCALLYILIA